MRIDGVFASSDLAAGVGPVGRCPESVPGILTAVLVRSSASLDLGPDPRCSGLLRCSIPDGQPALVSLTS